MINEDLRRWFKEKWVDISRKTKSGKHPPCGRSKASDSKYPKCRPSRRVSSETPETSGEMSREEKKKAVRQKRSAEASVSTTKQGRKPVMTSHKKINEECGCKHEKMEKIVKFLKKKNKTLKESYFNIDKNKVMLENLDYSCLNKNVFVYFINEMNEFKHVKGVIKIASNSSLKEGFDLEVVDGEQVTKLKLEDILQLKYNDNNTIKQYDITSLNEENKPTNPKLWSQAKSLAKKKFKVYPSAYANGWASKWYKKHGGGWKSVNEQAEQDTTTLTEQKKKEKMVASLKPKMKQLFSKMSAMNEEIVNAKHEGTMTKKEIKSRDRIAKKVKAKPIKGKDTAENAKYRLATYIELRKRGQEPKGKAPKKGKKKKKDTGK